MSCSSAVTVKKMHDGQTFWSCYSGRILRGKARRFYNALKTFLRKEEFVVWFIETSQNCCGLACK